MARNIEARVRQTVQEATKKLSSEEGVSRRNFLINAGAVVGALGIGILGGERIGELRAVYKIVKNPEDYVDPTTTTSGTTVRIAEDKNFTTPGTTSDKAPTTTTTEAVAMQKEGIALPSEITGDLARSLKENGNFPRYQEGQWFLPVYNEAHANAKYDWEGIGPWCPEFFQNIDSNAAHLGTHGMPGETIIVADNGGIVEFGVMQLGPHQNDGLMNGNGDFDPNWKMQYTFKGMVPFQEIIPFDPDTREQLTWPDETPIVYKASEAGDFSVELPKTDGKMDVRVAFRFRMYPSNGGSSVQAHEVKIERGPNDHPNKTGENHLPEDQVIKPPVKS